MARLLIKTGGFENKLFELKLGLNRIGRSPDTDFPIPHPTISTLHCEVVLQGSAVLLRDLESTNGTFVDGRPVREAEIFAGQTIQLGDVELLVESTEVKVAIPTFTNPELPAPPKVAADGGVMCPRHAHAKVSHQCKVCKEVMCDACVHRIRRKGSKTLLELCPICSNAVELIGGVRKPTRKSFLERVGETVKLKMTRVLHGPGNRQP